ncbi:MAG: HAMP domain-containing protein [Rhodospirillales bacterium]|nr:HAMP domain-containing protein [Rhodospirillales bacterium]MBO6785897.1 HAMP domain-containing protein [Rhodospirillales bacterium]
MTRIRALLARLWPKGLMGQTVMLVLLALFSAQIISALIIRSEARDFYRGAEVRFLAERIAPVAGLMQGTEPAFRGKLADALSNRRLRVWLSSEAAVEAAAPGAKREDDDDDDRERMRDLAERITEEVDGIPSRNVRVYQHHHRDRDDDDDRHHGAGPRLRTGVLEGAGLPFEARYTSTVISIRLGDGQWMNAALNARPARRLFGNDTWISFLITASVISLIVVIALSRITRPMRKLSVAARRLGRGENIQPLREEGPADIRDTIRAFNEMQDRLQRFVTERTKMLAAISHDLRTPITSLRLRAEMLDDAEAREKMIQTLADMQDMVEATLAFAREEAAAEPTRPADLGALLGAVADDLRDLGHAVELKAATPVTYPCRPLAMRRALTNLVLNAATYGDTAHVTLTARDGAPRIMIEDDGPGIPPDQLDRIFEPFVRLETSRNQETGGIGLGMSIARDIIRRHGGDIRLENMDEGGLRVTISLPPAQD